MIAKPRLTGMDACVMMHAALRKCCDSKVTSAAYNMIHLIRIEPPEFNAWRLLGDLAAEELEDGSSPTGALVGALARLEDVYFARVEKLLGTERREPERARAALYALLCTLQCFSDVDLDGMASYLGDDS